MRARNLLVLLLPGLGCHLATAQSNGTEPPRVVPVATVARADLSTDLVLTGEFEPFQEVDVMAKVAGYVETLSVDIGARVNAGQLLATLEVPEIQDELAKTKADVDSARSSLEAAQNEEQRASASNDIAHLSFTRLSEVVKREPGLVPQQDLDVARTHDLEAAAQFAEAKSKIHASEGRLRMAQAEEARLTTLCRYARITAPFCGVITKRYASIGSMIQAGISSQTQAMPVVRLSQNDLLRLVVPVPEAAVPSVEVGQPVDVRVHALEKAFTAKVSRIAEQVQMSTRTMNGEIDVSNPDLKLVPGMYADVILRTRQSAGALTVPLDAVEDLGGEHPRVLRVSKNGQLHVIAVTTGLETATQVEIRSGLTEGDQVVTGRHTGLREGQLVQPRVVVTDGAGPRMAESH